jgi:thiol:disulfide interchange protein
VFSFLEPEHLDTPDGLNMYTNIDQALQESNHVNKPLFMIFYSDWCPKCHVFFNSTLTDPLVKSKLNKDYVVVKVDTTRNSELKKEYNVNHRPTLIILTPEKSEISRIVGPISPKELLNKI